MTAAYGLLAVGRAFIGLAVFHLSPTVMASCTCRYHYLPSIGIILLLALVVDVLDQSVSLGDRTKDFALFLVFSVVVGAYL